MLENFSIIDLINPEFYIQLGGLWLILLIVFSETGLFVGFFFPGDSLLFVSGIYAVDIIQPQFAVNESFCLWILIVLTAASAIVGNLLGYGIGRWSKDFFYHAKDRWYYKKKYLDQGHDFYEKHGGFAVSFARFVPIVRTFVPIVAGIVDMKFSAFVMYTIIGGIIWPLVLQSAGFYLYTFFIETYGIDIKEYIEIIVVGIILVSTAPIIYNFVKGKKSST